MASYDNKLLDGSGLQYFLQKTDPVFVKPSETISVPDTLDFTNIIVIWGEFSIHRCSFPQGRRIGPGTFVLRILPNTSASEVWRISSGIIGGSGNFSGLYYRLINVQDETGDYSLGYYEICSDSGYTSLIKNVPRSYDGLTASYTDSAAGSYTHYENMGLKYTGEWNEPNANFDDPNITGFQTNPGLGISPEGFPKFSFDSL